jgi:hypothetical protein
MRSLGSLLTLLQCIEKIPNGIIKNIDNKICPPTKTELKESMEAVIHHFKIYTNGITIPSNEIYVSTEAPKGEFSRRRQLCCILILKYYTYFILIVIFNINVLKLESVFIFF